MVFSFDGICKKCGADIHMVFDVDKSDEIPHFFRYTMCKAKPEAAERERLYQIMDYLDLHWSRFSLIDLRRIDFRNDL